MIVTGETYLSAYNRKGVDFFKDCEFLVIIIVNLRIFTILFLAITIQLLLLLNHFANIGVEGQNPHPVLKKC